MQAERWEGGLREPAVVSDAVANSAALARLCHALGGRDACGSGLSRAVAVQFKCDMAAAEVLARRGGEGWRDQNPEWDAALQTNRSRAEALLAATGEFSQILEAAGCPVVAVEGGGVVAAHVGIDPGGYDSGDIDLLVGGPGALARVLPLARTAGWRIEDSTPRHVTLTREEVGHLLRLEVDADAFYRRVWPRPGRRHDWLAHRLTSGVAAPGLRVLSAPHSLVYTAVHASIHTYLRSPGLRLFVDLHRLIEHSDLAWDRVLTLASNTRNRTRLYVALNLAQQLLSTPVPTEVLQALAPHRIRQLAIKRFFAGRGFLPPSRPLRRHHVAIAEALLVDTHH